MVNRIRQRQRKLAFHRVDRVQALELDPNGVYGAHFHAP
jgi:hypothetical protein